MALGIFSTLARITPIIINNIYIPFYYLIIAVCEGALGLRVVVIFTRTKGNDALLRKIILL